MAGPRKWRKDGVKSKNGTSWRLMTGRDGDRETLGLGQITEEQVDRCLASMQAEENETFGTPQYGRALRLAAEPDGRANVVRYLLGDPARGFAPELVDHGAQRLCTYLEEVWMPVRSTERPASWRNERLLWEGNLLPALGRYRVRDLNHVVFDEFINGVTKRNGEPVSWNTKRLIRAAYQACLIHAERKGHIPAVHRFYPLKGSGTVWAKAKPLDSIEIVALVNAAPTAMHAALFGFSFEGAARPGEVTRLCWEDIDWTRSDRSPFGKVLIRGTKTEASTRIVPLLAMSRELLDAHWVAEGRPTSGIVFTIAGAPIKSWKKSLKTAAAKAGITDRRIFPYLGRHTALTAAMDAGATKDEAAALAGHTNPRMVERVYDHGDAADRIDVSRLPVRTR